MHVCSHAHWRSCDVIVNNIDERDYTCLSLCGEFYNMLIAGKLVVIASFIISTSVQPGRPKQ